MTKEFQWTAATCTSTISIASGWTYRSCRPDSIRLRYTRRFDCVPVSAKYVARRRRTRIEVYSSTGTRRMRILAQHACGGEKNWLIVLYFCFAIFAFDYSLTLVVVRRKVFLVSNLNNVNVGFLWSEPGSYFTHTRCMLTSYYGNRGPQIGITKMFQC